MLVSKSEQVAAQESEEAPAEDGEKTSVMSTGDVEFDRAYHELELRWDFLRAWCGALCHKVKLVAKDKAVRLGVELTADIDVPMLVSLRQALDLLSVVSKVDRVALIRALVSYCFVFDLTSDDFTKIIESPEPMFIELTIADPGNARDREKLATVLKTFFLPPCGPVSAIWIAQVTTDGSIDDRDYKVSSRDYADTTRRVVWNVGSARCKLDLPVRVEVRQGNNNNSSDFAGRLCMHSCM